MARFVLTAQLQLQAPSNVRNVVNQINSQLKGLTANVNVTVNQQQIQQLKNLNKTVKQTGQTAKVAGSDMQAFGKQAALAIRRFGAFVTATFAFRRFVSAIGSGLKEAIQFERELVRIAQVTDRSIKSLSGLTSEVSLLSTKFGVSSSSLIKVSRILSQTGLEAKKVQIALGALAKSDLAPTFNNIIQTTEAAIAIFKQFNIQVEDLESTLGSINAVAGKFAVESSDIAAAIRRTGGAFAAAGGSLKELIALFTSVRSTTRESAESIATGFRTIFTRLQRARTINFLKNLGINLRTATGEFIGPFKAIQKLNEALSNLSTTDPRFAQITEELGGFRQVSKVIPLIKQFSEAQRALNVAQAGGSSLSRDAAKAQDTLAVRLQKVREELTLLLRKFANSQAFKTFTNAALILARAVIKISDALSPLLTLFSALALPLAASGISKFLGKSKGSGFIGTLRGFNQGGLVPGSGNTDTVPAMLQPGEFVLRKKAVQNIGLGDVKRFNTGGRVGMGPGGFVPNLTGRNLAPGNEGRKKQFRSQRIDFLRRGRDAGVLNSAELAELANLEARQGASQASRTSRFAKRFGFGGGGIIQKFQDGGLVNQSRVGAAVLEAQGRHKDFAGADGIAVKGKLFDVIRSGLNPSVSQEFSGKLDQGIINAASATSQDLGGPPIARGEGNRFLGTVNQAARGNLFEDVLRVIGSKGRFSDAQSAGANFDFRSGLGSVLADDFPRLAGIQFIDAKASFDKANKESFIKKITNQLNAEGFKQGQAKGTTAATFEAASEADKQKVRDILNKRTGIGGDTTFLQSVFGAKLKKKEMQEIAFSIKKAAGGAISGGDTVPALLTPGEFVVNKKSVQRVGLDNLEKINKVRKFGRGGFVKGFQGGGAVKGGGGALGNASNLFILGAVATQLVSSFVDAESAVGKFTTGLTGIATQFVLLNAILKGVVGNKQVKSISQFVPFSGPNVENKLKSQSSSLKAAGIKNAEEIPKLEKRRADLLKLQEKFDRRAVNLAASRASLPKPDSIDPKKAQELAAAQESINRRRQDVINRSVSESINESLPAGLDKRQRRREVRKLRKRIASEDFSVLSANNAKKLANLSAEEAAITKETNRLKAQNNLFIKKELENNRKNVAQNTRRQLTVARERGINDTAIQTTNDAGTAIRGRRRGSILARRAFRAGKGALGFANKFAPQIGAGVAVGGQFLGGLATDSANARIAKGEDASGLAGLGGALSGAGTGAAIGAAFGPLGIAIGGSVGALVGFASATKKAAEELSRVKFQKSVQQFNDSLQSVLTREATIESQSSSIAAGVRSQLDRVTQISSQQDRDDLSGQLRESSGELSRLFNQVASTSDTIGEFEGKIGTDLLRAFAELTATTENGVIKKFKEAIESRAKLNKLNNDAIIAQTLLVARIKSIADITSVFQDASFAVRNFNSVLTDLTSGSSAIGDTTSILERPSTVTDRPAFNNAISRVTGVIGQRGAQLGQDANLAQQVASQTQSLLSRTRAEDPLSQQGDFVDRFLQKFDREFQGPGAKFARDIVKRRLDAVIGDESKSEKILKEFDLDPSKITDKVVAGFDKVIAPIIQAGKLIDSQLNTVIAFSKARVQKEAEISAVTGRIIDITQQQVRFFDRLDNRNTNVARSDSFDRQRFSNISGGATGTSTQIGNQAIAAQQKALDLTQKINALDSKDFNQRVALIEQRAQEEQKLGKLVKALEFTANVSERIASRQNRLSEINAQRQQKFSFASNFVFGDNNQRRDVAKNIGAVSAVGRGGLDLSQIPESQRSGVRGTLQSLSDVRLAAFGKTIDKVTGQTRNRSGRELERDIVEKSLIRFGADRKEAARAALKITTPEEEKLRNEISQLFKDAASAQEALRKILESQNKSLIDALKNSNATFLAKLAQLFAQRDVADAKNKVTTQTREVNTIQGQIAARNRLNKRFNRNIKSEEDLAGIQRNVNDIQAIRGIGQTRGALSEAFATGRSAAGKLVRGGLKGVETTEAQIQKLIESRVGTAFEGGGDKGVKTNVIDRLRGEEGAEVRRLFDTANEFFNFANKASKSGRFADEFENKRTAEGALQRAGELLRKIIVDETSKLNAQSDPISGRLQRAGISASITDKELSSVKQDIESLKGVQFKGLNESLETATQSLNAFKVELDKLTGGNSSKTNNLQKGNNALRAFFSPNFKLPSFATGGLVGGSGTGDTVPAMLSPGEFVMTKDATRAIGVNKLSAANKGVQKFQNGGLVQNMSGPNDAMNSVIHDFSRADKLITALNNFPREVQHTFAGQVEVIFNGAEVMTNIMPEMQALVTARVKDGLNKLIQDKFPDAGPID